MIIVISCFLCKLYNGTWNYDNVYSRCSCAFLLHCIDYWNEGENRNRQKVYTTAIFLPMFLLKTKCHNMKRTYPTTLLCHCHPFLRNKGHKLIHIVQGEKVYIAMHGILTTSLGSFKKSKCCFYMISLCLGSNTAMFYFVRLYLISVNTDISSWIFYFVYNFFFFFFNIIFLLFSPSHFLYLI